MQYARSCSPPSAKGKETSGGVRGKLTCEGHEGHRSRDSCKPRTIDQHFPGLQHTKQFKLQGGYRDRQGATGGDGPPLPPSWVWIGLSRALGPIPSSSFNPPDLDEDDHALRTLLFLVVDSISPIFRSGSPVDSNFFFSFVQFIQKLPITPHRAILSPPLLKSSPSPAAIAWDSISQPFCCSAASRIDTRLGHCLALRPFP